MKARWKAKYDTEGSGVRGEGNPMGFLNDVGHVYPSKQIRAENSDDSGITHTLYLTAVDFAWHEIWAI